VELGGDIKGIFNKLLVWIDSFFMTAIGNSIRKLGSILELVTSQRLVRDALGTKETKILNNLGKRLSTQGDRSFVENKQTAIADETAALVKTLREDLARNLAARTNSRTADLNKQSDALNIAQFALKGLVDAAKFKEQMAEATKFAREFMELGLGAVFAQEKNQTVAAVEMAGTRGGFDIGQGAQQFGFQTGVVKKIEVNTKNMVDKMDRLNELIPQLRDEFA